MCRLFAGQDPDRYRLETRRMRLNGQSTSIRLENAFWRILDEIAAGEGISTPAFVSKLHARCSNFTASSRTLPRSCAAPVCCTARASAITSPTPSRPSEQTAA